MTIGKQLADIAARTPFCYVQQTHRRRSVIRECFPPGESSTPQRHRGKYETITRGFIRRGMFHDRIARTERGGPTQPGRGSASRDDHGYVARSGHPRDGSRRGHVARGVSATRRARTWLTVFRLADTRWSFAGRASPPTRPSSRSATARPSRATSCCDASTQQLDRVVISASPRLNETIEQALTKQKSRRQHRDASCRATSFGRSRTPMPPRPRREFPASRRSEMRARESSYRSAAPSRACRTSR